MEMREVAGLWCSDALERVNDYFDGELTEEERAQVEAHLSGCDNCARFCAGFGRVLDALHRQATDVRLPDGLLEKISAELERREEPDGSPP